MRSKKELRESLGITQQETALLIGAKLSSLAMYEIGQRELSSQQFLELIAMQEYVRMHKNHLKKNKLILEEQKRAKNILEKELKKLTFEKKITQDKFEEANNKYEKAIAALTLLHYLENNEMYKKEKQIVLEKIKLSAECTIEKYGPVVQTQLNLKLKMIAFQIEITKNAIDACN